MKRLFTNTIFYAFMFAQPLWDLRNVVTVHNQTCLACAIRVEDIFNIRFELLLDTA